jgi:hypothetical protein
MGSSRTLKSIRTICHYVRTDASLNCSKLLDTDGRPNGKFSSSVRMMLWQKGVRTGIHVLRTDDTLDSWVSRRDDTSSGRWRGTEFSDLQTVQNLLEALMNSRIPVKRHHYNEVILSNRMWPITNQQNTIPNQIKHILPLFVSKGQWVNKV